MSNLPMTFKPSTDVVEETDVVPEIDEPVVSEESAIEIMERMGNIKVSSKELSEMGKLGIYVNGAGVLRLQRGMALINQQRLNAVLGALTGMVIGGAAGESVGPKRKQLTIRHLIGLAEVMGRLSSKLTESQKFMLAMQAGKPSGKQGDDGPPPRQTFGAGEQLAPLKHGGTNIIAQHVHVNGAGSP